MKRYLSDLAVNILCLGSFINCVTELTTHCIILRHKRVTFATPGQITTGKSYHFKLDSDFFLFILSDKKELEKQLETSRVSSSSFQKVR